MSSNEPSKEVAHHTLHQAVKRTRELHKQKNELRLKRNEPASILVAPLVKSIEENGNKEDLANAHKALLEQSRELLSKVKLPSPRHNPQLPTPERGGFTQVISAPFWTAQWYQGGPGPNTDTADTSNGEVQIKAYAPPDPTNVSSYAAAGVATFFNPPLGGIYNLSVQADWEWGWFIGGGTKGGGSTSAMFTYCVFAYLDGQHLPQYDRSQTVTIWSDSVGPSTISNFNNPWGYQQDEAFNPPPLTLQLASGLGYAFWAWFVVNADSDVSSGGVAGNVLALVNSFTLVSTD
jgi:hypothetical protein